VPAQSSKGRDAGKRSAAWWRRKKGDARENKRQIEREEGEQRRKRNEISQGLMRKFRKSQGPFCKVKFPINLKPE
jgi:hypothetical protein